LNYIQTLYLDKSKDPLNHSFGWAAAEYHLMSWALSCLQLNKNYEKVELYANSQAASLLLDTLKLPYQAVHVTHDNLHFAHENLWALPKILTYSLQDSPFLHIDGDVFLFSKFQDSLLRGELIAQNIEDATDYYTSTQKELITNFTYFPQCVRTDFESSVPIRAINAGILGGNNIDFFKEYASVAFEYIQRNARHLSSINVDRFNVFFEQHLFYSLAKERNIPISVLIDDVINDNEYKYLGDIHEAPCCKSYFHLLGHLKKDEYTCVQMAAKLRELYPECYYRIISLFKKGNVATSISLYHSKKLDRIEDYLVLNKNAKDTYRKPKFQKGFKINNFDTEQNNVVIPELALLETIIGNGKIDSPFVKNELEKDFKIFSRHLLKYLHGSKRICPEWLYGRDLESINWYCQLFANETVLKEKAISKCNEICIIESGFDWAGLVNKHRRVGIRYYQGLEITVGHFFNLVVPEINKNGFSLFDLDELEKLILDQLDNPVSIEVLLKKMQCYAEDDVVRYHLETYNSLIITFIKQLVVKKAIKPIFNIAK